MTAKIAAKLIAYSDALIQHFATDAICKKNEAVKPPTGSKRPNPLLPVYICHYCAKQKKLQKAEKIWVREGQCSYCNKKAFICQIIEYIEMLSWDSH